MTLDEVADRAELQDRGALDGMGWNEHVELKLGRQEDGVEPVAGLKDAASWLEYFDEQFSKESDRACVVLGGAMLDDALYSLLKSFLVPNPSGTDSLFDSPTAPLATFSGRIDMVFRVGGISKRLCRDLHQVRRIRNEFAHNVTGCTFQASSVMNRVTELSKSFRMLLADKMNRQIHGDDVRKKFQFIVGWMIFYLWSRVDSAPSVGEPSEEWGYSYERTASVPTPSPKAPP